MSFSTTCYFQGIAMGGSLIVAIGAQNAFVLTQGVRRNHHLAVAGVCIVCDALLIVLGVAGVGAVVAQSPFLAKLAGIGGAMFLAWYGLTAFRRALKPGVLQAENHGQKSLGRTLGLTLAVTLLNPHVYLDTVVIMGGLSGRYPIPERYIFGLGAITASLFWFLGLSLGGRLMAPIFSRPVTWRVLDGIICLTMWGIALSLILSLY